MTQETKKEITDAKGISTRVMLVAALVLVIASVTSASLLIVRQQMRLQVATDLSADLTRSVETFQDLEAQQLAALQRENALMADLPSLKALMTTNDEGTIADGAVEFWKVSGNDLFALASRDGRVVAAYTRGAPATLELRDNLGRVATQVNKHYLLSGGRLFEYSARPLYFGSEATGTQLGYVINGYEIDTAFLKRVSRSSSAEAAFLATNVVVASTLEPFSKGSFREHEKLLTLGTSAPETLSLGGERYLAIAENLSDSATVPLRLVVMKSFQHADQVQGEINRLVAVVGLLALLIGSVLMLALSSVVTRPLELLANSVRAFGTGNSKHSLPQRGTLEVRELSAAFASMRREIEDSHRALLESERLATIGRMASSVSHDVRHYLAAVYANAEFLASSRLSEAERAELFAEIRIAVEGTTELIESLLIFSRTGGDVPRTMELMATVVERSIALVRAHPDAQGVALRVQCDNPIDTGAIVDSKQMERAIYNLVLNACQSARAAGEKREVAVEIASSKEILTVKITDNGPGVSSSIRESLFQPFVSAGKQRGTGLGLTLAQCVAEEHGGSVRLVSSRPGEAVFLLSIARYSGRESLQKESSTVVTG